MVEIAQRVQKIGGSLMVRIPKDVADEANITAGDTVYFSPQKQRTVLFGKYPELGEWKKPRPEEFSKYA